MFPILNDPVVRAIPWPVIAGHEAQAQKNHYQSLTRLAERGGLSVVEAVVVLLDIPFPSDRSFTPSKLAEYRHILMRIIRDFESARLALEGSRSDD
jgi:hypothetical protein